MNMRAHAGGVRFDLLRSWIGFLALALSLLKPLSVAAASLTASVTATPTSGTAPLAVSFTGSRSGGVYPYTFNWDFGDGTSANYLSPNHTYSTAGTYTATLTVTDSTSATATASRVITVAVPFDFSLTTGGNLSAVQGTTTSNTVAAAPVSGTPQPISLTATGLPAGATASFSRSSCSPSCTSTLNITTATSTAPGTYTIAVTGAGGNATHTQSFNLTVVTPLAAAATATSTSGPAPLAVSFTGSRSGGVYPYTFNWDFGDGTSANYLSPNHTYSTAGTYTATLTVTDSTSATATASQVVTVAVPFDFSLTTSGSLSILQGISGTETVTATLVSGTPQPISLTTTGLPAGATASFSRSSCSPSCVSTLNIAIATSTAPGTYTITVTGAGGNATHTRTFNLTVSPATLLSLGQNIQSAINANPPGTAFVLQAGVYRMQSLTPLAGDSFTGQPGADLNGSQVLSNWVQSGSYWTSTGAPALNNPYGNPSQYCTDPTTDCVDPQDLYLNNQPLVHKLNLPISSGQWYFDYANDVVYMADNPFGQTVELSVAQQAFQGPYNNVTVQNLIVEKYASPLMTGAIYPLGWSWTIQSNEVRLNHAAGIKAGNGQGLNNNELILSNNVHNNGQEGIAVNSGTGTVVEYNTVSSNNYLNLAVGVEAGGGKVCGTTSAQIINNTFSNNNGDGLWADCGATSTTFLGNTITGNSLSGIRYEVSHAGMISNNTLVNNAQSQAGSCNANEREIFLISSDNTSVAGNTITSNCAGIALAQDSRNPTVNDSVTYNSTTYSGSVVLPYGTGGIDLLTPTVLYNPASQNYFDYNAYHFGSPSMLTLNNWLWGSAGGSPTQMKWTAWQAAGEDPNGVAD